MINTSDPALENDEVLKIQLAVFKSEHRDLDDAIGALVEKGTADQLTLQRLKKRKLALKDKISRYFIFKRQFSFLKPLQGQLICGALLNQSTYRIIQIAVFAFKHCQLDL